MTQQYTPAQLEAWSGLGPWSWSEETICRQIYHFLGPGVLVTTETDGTPWGDTIDQTNAALIAAAPDLARLVLEKDKEIARLKAANYAAFTDGMEAAAQICGTLAEVEYDDADGFEAATGCEAAIMQVVKEQRSEQAKPEKDQAND